MIPKKFLYEETIYMGGGTYIVKLENKGLKIQSETSYIPKPDVVVKPSTREWEDFFKTHKSPDSKLLIVFNPPYGERLDLDFKSFYSQIGSTLKHNYSGSISWFITSNLEALKHVGLRPSRKIKLFNAKLESRFVKYELYSGTKKTHRQKK